MFRKYRLTFLIAFSLIFFYSHAQKISPEESRFKNARELLELGKYSMAMQAFEPLTKTYAGNHYTKISSFYYAIAAYNDGQMHVAKDMFLQILQKYPSWDKLEEVNLWMANIFLEEGNYARGLNYASFIKTPDIKAQVTSIKKEHLAALSFNELDSLFNSKSGRLCYG